MHIKTITKEGLLNKFGNSFVSEVTYKDKKKVKYDTPKHINWKNVLRIKVFFEKSHLHLCEGELVSRNGVAYRLV